MEIVKIILAIISIVLTLVSTPTFIAFKKAVKARKNAETEAAKEKANADLLETAKGFIAAAEVAFDGFDKMMKSQGSSAGAMKKDNVFSKLQAYALQNGYEFNADEWSDKIDELVKFTKNVNKSA
jgi:hypothetical protein